LFERIGVYRQAYNALFSQTEFAELWKQASDCEERAIAYRLTFLRDSQSHGRQDLLTAEQHSDTQLKAVVAEWELVLSKLCDHVHDRAEAELSPKVFPQNSACRIMLEDWKQRFGSDRMQLEENNTLKARVSQKEVTQLQTFITTTRHKLKQAKDQLSLQAKKKKKDAEKDGATSHALTRRDEDLLESDESNDKTEKLNTDILLGNQKQIECVSAAPSLPHTR
jgi:hypothetical protein